MCTKNLHVDIWSWVIGHGELESGVYFDRGGRRAALFGFFFVAPQGRPAPAPCLVCCSGLLRVFMAPEGREKIPEKGARHRGRLRWPHAPPDPKGGSRTRHGEKPAPPPKQGVGLSFTALGFRSPKKNAGLASA
jgi:hypothetical protein